MSRAASGPDLEALLGSRICHDLISPLGAISNGMELLAMSGAARGPEFALIAESVDNANARIRFFRIAFGVAGCEQTIGAPEVRSVLAGLSAGSKTAHRWEVDGDLLRTEVKLAFLLIQCLETAMPWGGTITVRREGDLFGMRAEAGRLKDLGPLWGQFDTSPAAMAMEASEVHFPLAARTARHLGRAVVADLAEDRIELTF